MFILQVNSKYLPTSHVCWDLTVTVGNTEFKKLVLCLAVCPPSLWRTSMDPVLFTLRWLVKTHTNHERLQVTYREGWELFTRAADLFLLWPDSLCCISGITGILMSAAALPVCLTRPPKLVLHPPPVSKSDIKPVPGFGHCCRKTTKKQARKGKHYNEDETRKRHSYDSTSALVWWKASICTPRCARYEPGSLCLSSACLQS